MIRAEDFCKRVFDGTHETPKPCETGYKLLTSKNILDGFLDKSNAYYISEEDYNSINQRSGVQTWDILFSMIGTVGNVCLIQDSKIDFAIKNMGVFSCEDEWKAKWLYFYFQSPYAKSVIKNYLNGAVQKFLPLEVLRAFPVPQFDCNKEYITKFLWPIERKLSLNRKINATLEAMAKTLYDYWFVQFDFPDKKGRPYKTSGGKMVYNEELGREIPEGWEVAPLQAIAHIVQGNSPEGETLNETGDGMVFYQGKADFGFRFPDVRTYTTSPYRIAEKFDTLLSVRAPVGSVNMAREKCCIGRGLAAIRCDFPSFMYYTLMKIQPHLEKYSGIGTTFNAITKDDIMAFKILQPHRSQISHFEKIVSNYDKDIMCRTEENRRLAALRDWLLPMLMNGQVGFETK